MRLLHELTPMGHILSPQKFFEPREDFFTFIEETVSKDISGDVQVYDVGCGMGHVAKSLRSRGFNALGIDINYREGGEEILIANGALFNYQPNSTILLCRPCHGIFVSGVIEQAIKCDVDQILYVGLDKNLHLDLDGYVARAVKYTGPFGFGGESIWSLKL